MVDEALESLTRAVLAMSAALLLHYSETFGDRLVKKKRSKRTPQRNGSSKNAPHVSFGDSRDVASSAGRFSDIDDESYRLARPTVPPSRRQILRDMQDSYRSYAAPPSIRMPGTPVRKLVRMTPSHHSTLPSSIWPSFYRSPPPSPESERSFRIARVPRAPPGYDYSAKFERDYSYPVASAARSVRRSPQPRQLFIDETVPSLADSSAPSESETSFQIVRPAGGIKYRERYGDPYLYRPHSFVSSARYPQQRSSPRTEQLDDVSYPEYGEPSPRVATVYPDELPEEYLDDRDFPEELPRTDPLEYDETADQQIEENLASGQFPDFTPLSFASSLPSRSTTRHSPGTTFETDSVRFPDLSRLPPTPRGASLASDQQSASVRSENWTQPSRQENLADVSTGCFAPELNSTFVTSPYERSRAGVDSLEETINTLIAKINRQAEIIRAGKRPAEHERIGIIRRNSEDFDTETGQMKELK